MKIIIIGIGKVGYKIANSLSKEGHEITAIDKNDEAVRHASENLDIMCITGNGVSVQALTEAGISECDILIAVSAVDEVNMVCCLIGKKLGAKYTVARIREYYYNSEIHLLKEELELNLAINPEEAAAKEIAKMLRYPGTVYVEDFANGSAELIEIKIEHDNILCNKNLKEIQRNVFSDILIAAVSRNFEIIIPNGDFVIKPEDIIYIIGNPSNVIGFCKKIGVYSEHKIKNLMLIGGGRISYYLIESVRQNGMKAKVIEKHDLKGIDFFENQSDVLVILGDGTDEELLLSENLEDMDAFIALTGHDEDNFMSGLIAKEHKVPKIITKISRINYINIVKKLGIESVICPASITANNIIKFVAGLTNSHGIPIESLFKFLEDKADIMEFKINSSCSFINIPLKKLNIQPSVLVAVIIRKNKVIIPHGNDVIKFNDSVIIITNTQTNYDINSMISTSN